VPKDIYVNWSEIGQKAERLRFVSLALVDMILETGDPDVVIGVALSGLPLATLVADEIGAELAVFCSTKNKRDLKMAALRAHLVKTSLILREKAVR